MTKATKKKHVVQELISACEDTLPADNERFVKVLSGRGNNLHEVEEIGKDGEKFLVSMPSKFRRTVWVKRGDYLLVTDIPEGDKVKAEITEILKRKRINWLRKAGVWPESDEKTVESEEVEFVNDNRKNIPQVYSDSSSEED